MKSPTELSHAEQLKNKVILLTGGAGFIGSHIAEGLLKLDIKRLLIIDNLSTGNIDNLNVTNILQDSRVVFYQEDVGELEILKSIVESEQIDIICHQAALGSVPRSIMNPLATHKSNVDGFFNILLLAKENNIKRVVYASSSSVYGDSPKLPKTEYEVGDVISPYSATKKIDEIYANVFSRCYDMECIGLRYFNVFGPRQSVNGPYAAVIPRFADAIKRGERPIIYGNGEQSRDFTYVANVVQANILAMSLPSSSKNKPKSVFGRVYNIASSNRVSLNDMYKIFKELTGTTLEPIYEGTRKGDIEHSWASINDATNILGYQPIIGFVEGLKITLKYFMIH